MKRLISAGGLAVLVAVFVAAPAWGRGFGAARGGVAVGARRGAAAGGARAGSYTGPRGTTVQAGRAGGVATGPLGGVHAGGVQGARVTGPGGRSVTTGSHAGASVGPLGGVSAHAGGGTAVRGAYGSAAVGGRVGAAAGPFGGVAVHGGGVAVRGGGVGVGVRGGAVVHGTRYYSPSYMHTAGSYVRGSWGYRTFTPTWYRAHPAAWIAPRWAVNNFWIAPTWPAVSVYCGIAAPPITYDYGASVIIDNSTVYIDGEQVASAEDYATQATGFADRGRDAKPPETDTWQPLGVFGMIKDEGQTEAQNVFQLAVNKEGIIRGNYYDAVADNTLPVYGSVDSKTQRAAWSAGDKKTVVFEAGINNLTQEEATVLVHYGTERTQQMILVRLEEPAEEGK